MADKAPFSLRGRNPDVLACIANLSNDEVFTPPDLANRMLDTLADAWAESNGGKSIWEDSTVRFLDPCTKSGVFLREITRRLTHGLAAEIPDLRQRVDHILTNQVFGIAITKLTSLMARRTLYCSKHATGEHSIATSFCSDAGNVWFEPSEHSWSDTKCISCGAPKALLDRKAPLENYAYPFIHTADSAILNQFGYKMNFDVIIGNPPYQMSGGAGGSSDSSIYHLFVEKAIRLEPKYLSMVIPSRWMAGGRGLDDFRAKMLTDRRLNRLIDFTNSEDAFPGLQIKGGICYFLWSSDRHGPCRVTRVSNGREHVQPQRELGEFDVFVRDERALSILRKVLAHKEPSTVDLVSGDTPFGLATNFSDWRTTLSQNRIPLHLINGGKRTLAYADRSLV
jgi:site-specific DNA-methyltransferase (adenine-specific)